MNLDLQFPEWDIPDALPPLVAFPAYLQWLDDGQARSARQVEKLREDPTRRPADARFTLE
jgi:hypothetical protein